MDSDDLIDTLRRIGIEYGGVAGTVLPTRPDVIIMRAGSVVVKAHAPGAEREPLVERMRATAHPALRQIMLQPVTEEVITAGDRLVTVWPAGTPVNPADPDAAPWEAAARLLARLHAVPARTLPPLREAGGPGRVATTVARLGDRSAAELAVRRAFSCLPSPSAGPGGLTHGDWHMGQMVRAPDEWILIDNDDLGVGDQAWDLSRPAAWFAAGLLEPQVWHRFLDAYRAAGGTAVPPDGDPWERLEIPAQAMTIQLAAAAVSTAGRAGRPLDEVEEILVEACLRIIRHRSACHAVPTQ
ncbi:phosphotransferase family protein [Streptosporangium amethystogenes]|uniref:phosphotransferase family protein n=1 Tax=Streptosporangium amethystogenes TaxID=2002 RepID=UPI0004C7A967|nr:aminoglycoside phosphotransferase family protein [Streptosporangium amethystogenes]